MISQQSTKKTGRVVNPFCGLNTPRAKCCTAIIEVSQAAMNLLGRLTTELTENTEEKTERRTTLKNWNFSPPSVNSVCSVVNNPNFLVAALDRRSWRHRLFHRAGVMKI
jgi:hypothetical protein